MLERFKTWWNYVTIIYALDEISVKIDNLDRQISKNIYRIPNKNRVSQLKKQVNIMRDATRMCCGYIAK